MSTNSSFARIKEKIPYTGKGVDELLIFLRRVLSENKYTQKIVMEVGVPYIHIEKMVTGEEAQNIPQVSFHDSIRSAPMEEYKNESKLGPLHQLFEMFSIVHAEGLEVGFILVGNKHTFQQWLKLRIPVTKLALYGVPVHPVSEIPGDVFLVCGTPERIAEAGDVQFSVKGTCV